MTIKYGLQFFFFFELTDNDGQNFLAGIVLLTEYKMLPLALTYTLQGYLNFFSTMPAKKFWPSLSVNSKKKM
jgi:hypothetical protein